MADGIYIKHGRKTYRVVSGKCTKRTCSLYKAGVCDCEFGEDLKNHPCNPLYDIAEIMGGSLQMDANFREVKCK